MTQKIAILGTGTIGASWAAFYACKAINVRLFDANADALQSGYEKALKTILDANITTLIAAGFLFQFGSGPIKGFAVTLSVGIAASMFTAIFVTHTLWDAILFGKTVRKISI